MVRSSRIASSAFVLGVLSVLAACGGTETAPLVLTAPPGARLETPLSLAVVKGRLPASDRLTVVVDRGGTRYTVDAGPAISLAFLAEPRGASRPEATSPDPDLRPMVAVLEEAFATLAPAPVLREPAAGTAFVFDLPAGGETSIAPALAAARAAGGTLAFRIQVLPPERYARSWADGQTPPRLASGDLPWRGTAQEFEDFLARETRRWKEARASGKTYTPSDPRYRIAPRKGGGDTREPSDFVLLEEPGPGEPSFGGSDLVHPRAAHDPRDGQPVVLYEIRPESRGAFEAFTRRNMGLPLAVEVDGVVQTAAVIQSPLKDSVQITLGRGPRSRLEQEANALAAGLLSGGLPVKTKFVALTSRRADGRFEVVLPLGDRDEATLDLSATAPGGASSPPMRRVLARVAGATVSPQASADAILAGLRLGRIELGEGVVWLRRDLPRTLDAVAAALRDRGAPPLDRQNAAEILGRLAPGAPAAADALASVLADADVDLRRRAAESLARIDPDPARLPVLSAALEDPDTDVARSAVKGLVRLVASSPDALTPLLRRAVADEKITFAIEGELANRWDEVKTQVEGAIHAEDPKRRAVALGALAMAEPRSEEVWAGLRDAAPEVRRAAWRGVYGATMGRPADGSYDTTALARGLEDADEQVRGLASAVLGQLGDRAWPAVEPFLASDRAEVRAAALQAAARYAKPRNEIREAVEKALEDPDAQVRLTAAWAAVFQGLALERTLEVVRALLGSEVAKERRDAVSLLGAIGGRAHPAAKDVLPLLDDPDPDVRGTAAVALGEMGAATARSVSIAAAYEKQEREKARQGQASGDR